uniref:Uncharacterized protein n=1 Tax=Crocodylus porosus TaxID=8502 RepID=A0A7M4EEW0_CROPO
MQRPSAGGGGAVTGDDQTPVLGGHCNRDDQTPVPGEPAPGGAEDWIEKSKEQHTVKTDIPRQIKRKRVIKEKVKETQSLPAAKTKKDHSDTISIFGAAAKGDLSNLEKMLKENDINAVNASYETLLHIAAANGQIAVMEYLIKKGAKLEVKDSQGKTPLHRAAEKGHDDAVKVLLQAGAYIYSLDEAAKTPLHLAAQNHHSHILNRILKEEAKRYRNQHSFLHMAALKDDSSLAQMILKNGATVDAKDEKGQSALGYAVSQGFEKTVKVLLEAGASLSPDTMVSALFKAVQKNLHGIVAALVDKGTDINVYNEMGYTPLLMACELGKTESAEVLLEKGASLKEKMPNSDTALHLAVQAGAVSITSQLLSKGMNANIAMPGCFSLCLTPPGAQAELSGGEMLLCALPSLVREWLLFVCPPPPSPGRNLSGGEKLLCLQIRVALIWTTGMGGAV